MRIKKSGIGKCVSTFIAVALIMTVLVEAVPVRAQEHILDTGVRAALCPDCNVGEMSIVDYTSWSLWYHLDEVDCSHYPYGTDEVEERCRTKTISCTYCGSSIRSEQYQTRTVCHGYH